MSVYTVHLPAHALHGDRQVLEKAVLVRDGFSWLAFLFQPLWCLWNRMWLSALAILVLNVLFSAGLGLINAPDQAAGFAGILLGLLFGFEAGNLRRYMLERKGWPVVDVVQARNRDEATTLAYRRWLALTPAIAHIETAQAQPPANPPSAAQGDNKTLIQRSSSVRRASSNQSVIGLFPQAEGAR